VRGIAPEATYQFKHALIRDTAYEALLKSHRRELHRLVAQTIDAKFPTVKETIQKSSPSIGPMRVRSNPPSQPGRPPLKSAESRNAFQEARENYERAVALIRQLPASLQRDAKELGLLQSLYAMLSAGSGYAAPQTIEAAERATILAEKLGNLTKLVGWVRSRGHNL
jgi:predicted ATPase